MRSQRKLRHDGPDKPFQISSSPPPIAELYIEFTGRGRIAIRRVVFFSARARRRPYCLPLGRAARARVSAAPGLEVGVLRAPHGRVHGHARDLGEGGAKPSEDARSTEKIHGGPTRRTRASESIGATARDAGGSTRRRRTCVSADGRRNPGVARDEHCCCASASPYRPGATSRTHTSVVEEDGPGEEADQRRRRRGRRGPGRIDSDGPGRRPARGVDDGGAQQRRRDRARGPAAWR